MSFRRGGRHDKLGIDKNRVRRGKAELNDLPSSPDKHIRKAESGVWEWKEKADAETDPDVHVHDDSHGSVV